MSSIAVIKPTDYYIANTSAKFPSIFLAGSIEMGAAENWQDKVIRILEENEFTVTIFNPRRDSWDSSVEQRESNPEFNHQVNWEQNRLEESKIIFMYFDPNTKSPISLLELGQFASSGKMIVCCPDGFWRKGNVEVICSRYNIPLYNDLDSAIGRLMTIFYL